MSEVLFTAQAKAEGGRKGHVKSDDGMIDLDLVMPTDNKEGKSGTNPEQLFAAAYASCYNGAFNLVASKQKKLVESAVTAEVSFEKDSSDNGYKISAVLYIDVKGASQEEAEELAAKAHEVCPYSKAIRGNVDVELKPRAV